MERTGQNEGLKRDQHEAKSSKKKKKRVNEQTRPAISDKSARQADDETVEILC